MASATSNTTSHPFLRLPKELRLKIWRSLLPDARLVPLSLDEHENLVSNAIPPIGLQICKESRDETLRFYKLCFAADPAKARIYFSTDRDVVQLPSPYNRSLLSLVLFSRILTMANAAIKNDIKAVCMSKVWLMAGIVRALPQNTDSAPLPPFFGPNCRLLLFEQDKYGLLPFRHTLWVTAEKHFSHKTLWDLEIEAVYGTSKLIPIIQVEDPLNRTREMIVPRTPLNDQDWSGFEGYGSVVRQYIANNLVLPESWM